MLIAWGVSTLFAAFYSAWLRIRRQPDWGVLPLTALLVGPGAVPLARLVTRHKYHPGQGPVMAVLGLLGGFWSSLFILSQTVLPGYAALFEGMSLALPLPTNFLCLLTHWLQHPAGGLVFFALSLVWPVVVYRHLNQQAQVEDSAELLELWLVTAPALSLVVLLLAGLAFALLFPLEQLVGYIGG